MIFWRGKMNNFIEFTGEETEVEFLKKCIKQWKLTAGNTELTDMMKIMHIATIFHEMQHRIDELK
jgi:hypothetical protein